MPSYGWVDIALLMPSVECLVFLHFFIALIPSRHFTEMRNSLSTASKQEGGEGRGELRERLLLLLL